MTGMGGSPPGPGNASIIAEFRHALATQGAFALLLVVLLFVAWNQLRSMQHRRAVMRGKPYDTPAAPKAKEPAGRRFLRITFGLLWVFDGLLQLQSGMPVGLPSQVVQPAALGSPSWVQHLVNSALTLWTNHPASAAASTVWIQVGIGIFLLVAPPGWWSRGAGLVSVGWGLIVWAFGNAFGGIFAPGLTFLFGAPGAVLFYVVAGLLIALPDGAWSGRRMGRLIVGSTGGLLVGFAVLQAWPGRGFWQGTIGRQQGTLTAMVSQMAQTPQPHPLASLVSSFASFDQSHGWGVNLFAVVAMLAVGGILLAVAVSDRENGPGPLRPLLFPTMVVLAVLCIADWVFIEDFGFWGGLGTDPNSMLPILFVATGGYLALTRPAAAAPLASVEVPAVQAESTSSPGADATDETALEEQGSIDEAGTPVPVAAASDVTTGAAGPRVPARRSWWEQLDSTRAGRIAACIGALGILLIGIAPMAAATAARSADPQIAEAVNGAPNVTSGPAPPFRLVDQRGAPVSLAGLRGSTVVLTFLDPVCTTDCPVIAQELRVTASLLGSDVAKVRFVAIAANPVYYSVATVADFTRQEGLGSMPSWSFLTGSLPQLESVWNTYGALVQTAPAGGMVVHPDIVYVIDPHGILRRILNADPGAADSSSESSFSGLLASQVHQVQQQ
jgi:cytochrome oxidase Cu insertion factor (SCO1/SenC/PrrC family)